MAACPRIALFALTGIGNAVLRRLCEKGCAPNLVITRREPFAYPYFAEESLETTAGRLGVDIAYEKEGEARAGEMGGDLLLVATYHRLLPKWLRECFDHSINIHPSLLPRHRGANPFFWAIWMGDKLAGVTVHRIGPGVDDGEILAQAAFPLDPSETQGGLRRKCSLHAADLAAGLLDYWGMHRTFPLGWAQDEAQATLELRPDDKMRRLTGAETVAEAKRLIRALSPFPGALWNDRVIRAMMPPAGDVPALQQVTLTLFDGYLDCLIEHPKA